MKGLMRKDFYMIWNYGKTLLLCCAVFLVVGAMSKEENFFFVVYPVLLGGILPSSLLSYEERCGWNGFCDAMPLTRRTVVDARYVTTLVCFVLLYALTLLLNLIGGKSGSDLLQLVLLLPAFGLLAPAIMLPVSLYFGVEKGRILYFILVGGFVALGLFLFDSIRDVGAELHPGGLAASAVATLLIYGVSWLLSRRLYEKREL